MQVKEPFNPPRIAIDHRDMRRYKKLWEWYRHERLLDSMSPTSNQLYLMLNSTYGMYGRPPLADTITTMKHIVSLDEHEAKAQSQLHQGE